MKRSEQITFSTASSCVIIAVKQALLIGPQPTTETTLASGLARYLAATPGTAPVRAALSRLADTSAIGAPVSLSFSIIVRVERGRPLPGFAWFEPYHLLPQTSKRPPR
jgi:hypothetical protein